METVITLSRIIHIAAGTLALLCGLAAILYRRNIKRHRPFGKIYFWCMTIIFLTSLYLSVYRGNVFLFFIGIFTFHASFTALRSLQLKQLHLGQKPLPKDWLAEALNTLANLGLISAGIYYSIHGNSQMGIISVVFGSIGLRGSYTNVRRLRGNVNNRNYWLIAHISGMMASYIGAVTAFTVNNSRWLQLPDVALWLGPSVVLVPLIIYETNRFKTKAA